MKKTLLTLLIVMFVATPAMALFHDNGLKYAWVDTFGDMYDNYAEVHPGDTIRVHVFVNDLDGESWVRAADGGWTGIWWDSAVVDHTSVNWDANGIDTDGDGTDDIGNYYKSYWGFMHAGSGGGANYYNTKYDGSGTVRWVAENRLIMSWNLTIREDAPLGETTLGLQQAFYWNLPYNPWVDPFFQDRIEMDDPYAMKLMVLPAGRAGDFDGDGDIDADDIDALAAAIQASSTDLTYDMDGDGDVDLDDHAFHVHNLVDTALGEGTGTEFGDFNLDGMVSILDLGALGDGYGTGTGWASGDANGDGSVGILDLGFLGDNYGYDGSAIPEPTTMSLLALGGVTLMRRRSR